MSKAADSSQFVVGHWVVEEEHEHIVWTRFVKNTQRYYGMRSVANASRSLGSTEIIYNRDCPGQNDDTRRENSSEKVVHTVTFGTSDSTRIGSTITDTDASELSVDAEWRGMSLYFTSERPVRFSSFWTVDYSTPQANHLVSYCVWRPLSGRSWVLSSSIVLEATAGFKLIFLKSVFWHRPIEERSNTETEPSACADTSADSPQSFRATTRPIDLIEKEIDETTFALNAAEETLATLTSDLENCEAEIFELELSELGIDGLPRVLRDRQRYLLEREQKLRDYYDQAGHLKDEIATCTSDIEELKDTLAELETELDDANRGWDSESVELIEQAYSTAAEKPGFERPRVPKEDVFGERILSRLSAAARKIFETCQWTLHQQSDSAEHRRRYDNSHVIGYMAKCCERMFADAFSEKIDSLSTHPLAQELLRKPKEFQFEIPPKDTKHGITRGNLVRTLENVQQGITKKKEIEWSGTRNCGIAMLLFGSRLRFTNATSCELVNPLGAKGRSEKTTSLRVAMYKLQKIRNGFVHRHVARWPDVEKARIWFEKCVRGMASALYGLRSK